MLPGKTFEYMGRAFAYSRSLRCRIKAWTGFSLVKRTFRGAFHGDLDGVVGRNLLLPTTPTTLLRSFFGEGEHCKCRRCVGHEPADV